MLRPASLPLLLALAACGGPGPVRGPGTEPELSGEAMVEMNRVRPSTRLPDNPVDAVKALAAIATGRRSGDLDSYIDHDFLHQLLSVGELADVFLDLPGNCEPEFRVRDGYTAIAIPPPRDGDSEEETRRINGVIERLRHATEVHASCQIEVVQVQMEEERSSVEPHRERMMLYAIALGTGDDGTWRVLGWRDFRATAHGEARGTSGGESE